MVSVQDDQKGRVSLALEYAIASDYVLLQDGKITTAMDLYMNLAKAKGRNTFGSVLDLAGQALNQLPIPPNPYTQAGSKFLKFANDAIDSSLKAGDNQQIAHIALKFNQGQQNDLTKCESSGNERTGAIAVLRSVGTSSVPLIPVTDTEKNYCFRYSSGATYELLAGKRNNDGSCPAAKDYSGVPNDYVMLLISAQPSKTAPKSIAINALVDSANTESVQRCGNFGLPTAACGIQ